MECKLNAVAVSNCSVVGLVECGQSGLYFSTYDCNVFLHNPILFALGFILIQQQMWEKQEKHMGLHPDNTLWFTRAPGRRLTVLDVSSSFQPPPPSAVALGFPEYELLLDFSMTHTNFPGKLRMLT